MTCTGSNYCRFLEGGVAVVTKVIIERGNYLKCSLCAEIAQRGGVQRHFVILSLSSYKAKCGIRIVESPTRSQPLDSKMMIEDLYTE